MSGLARRCRLLMRAYPAWYRRERAGEMLDTLLQATPPGRRWPVFRETRALVLRGLRARGWVWALSMLWVAIGAGGAIYAAITFGHPGTGEGFRWMLQWPGEPQAIIDAGVATEVAWFLLTVPLLLAGFFRALLGRGPRKGLRVAGWAGSWVAGLVLLVQSAEWAVAGESGNRGVLGVGELVLCAGWLVVGVVMTLILSWSPPGGTLAGAGGRAEAGPV